MAQLELSVSTDFRARMSIPDHQGECRRPHGYRFVVKVTAVVALPEGGKPWTTDLVAIETATQDVVTELNGRNLADLIDYPSFEAILMWLVARLRERIAGLKHVELSAPPRYAMTWSEDVSDGGST